MTQVAVIGAGVMGEALVSGLLRAGWASDDIVVADRREGRRAESVSRHGQWPSRVAAITGARLACRSGRSLS